MKHRSSLLLAGLLFLGLAGVIVGFAQAKDVMSPTHSQALTSPIGNAPGSPALDSCGSPTSEAPMSVNTSPAGGPEMTPTTCPMRCATMLGYCDELPDGAACGIHASCHGICTTCNGKRDCFSQN